MSALFISRVTIKDQAKFQEYLRLSKELASQHRRAATCERKGASRTFWDASLTPACRDCEVPKHGRTGRLA